VYKYYFKCKNILERHQFSGQIHSAGELLHTPWRMPTSMATVLLSVWIYTFYGICISIYFGILTQCSVHPASPVLLTKNGPLRAYSNLFIQNSIVNNFFDWYTLYFFFKQVIRIKNYLKSQGILKYQLKNYQC